MGSERSVPPTDWSHFPPGSITLTTPDIATMSPPTPSPFLTIPPELIEAILFEIPRPQELLHLACTCSIFRDLIIPRHIEYRILKLPVMDFKGFDDIWYHLAQRPDLTSNIRKVNVAVHESDLQPGGPIYPKRLVDPDVDLDSPSVGNPDDVIISALRFMPNLESLTWRWKVPPSAKLLQFLFNTVSFLPTMRRMYLVIVASSSHTPGLKEFSIIPHRTPYLRHLRLGGRYWADQHLSTSTGNWLRSLTSIRSLRLNPSLIPQCDKLQFPSLRKLRLSAYASRPSFIQFLARHTQITVFDWPSIGSLSLPRGILPNLQSLRCDFKFLKAMNTADLVDAHGYDSFDRPIERLVLFNARWADRDDLPFCDFGCLDHRKLRYLSIRSIRLVLLQRLVMSFPMIKELEVQFIPLTFQMEELYETLQLLRLEVLQYPGYWERVDLPKEDFDTQLDEHVKTLATRLPNLREINYPLSPSKQIVIERGKTVTYRVENRAYTMFHEF